MDQQGYRYCKIRSSATRVFWRCCYYRKDTGSCPAKAQTEGFMISRKSGWHPHKPNEPIVRKPHGNSKRAKLKSENENSDEEQQELIIS